MQSISGAFSQAARSRFWLTFATLWLVGWLSFTPVHALVYDWDCTSGHCSTTPLPAHAHGGHSCGLCQLGNLPLVLATQQWQPVVSVSLHYVSASQLACGINPIQPDISPILRRGPPAQLHFA
jgi:hypothetical protein